MFKLFEKFRSDESGAVTVDWVVLTAAVVGLGMLVLNPIAFSTENSTQKIADDIRASRVGYENQ